MKFELILVRRLIASSYHLHILILKEVMGGYFGRKKGLWESLEQMEEFFPEGCCSFAPDRNWKTAAKKKKKEGKRCGCHGPKLGGRASEEGDRSPHKKS
jgi:hypothetical protein